jgi:hypothetical protein
MNDITATSKVNKQKPAMSGIANELAPTLARLVVEFLDAKVPQEHAAERASGWITSHTRIPVSEEITIEQRATLLYFSRIAYIGLHEADEVHQLDGWPALAFVDGFMQAEIRVPGFFVPSEEAAINEAINQLRADWDRHFENRNGPTLPREIAPPEAPPESMEGFFRLGWHSRRDQIKAAASETGRKP